MSPSSEHSSCEEDIFQDSASCSSNDPLTFEKLLAFEIFDPDLEALFPVRGASSPMPPSDPRNQKQSSPPSTQVPSSSLPLKSSLSISPALTQQVLCPSNYCDATFRVASLDTYSTLLHLNHPILAPVADNLAPDASATHALDQSECGLAQTSYPPSSANYFSLPSPVMSENDVTPTASVGCAASFPSRKRGPKRKAMDADADDGVSGSTDAIPRPRKCKRSDSSTRIPILAPKPELNPERKLGRESASRRSRRAKALPIDRHNGVAKSYRVANSDRTSLVCGYHYPGKIPNSKEDSDICKQSFSTADDLYRHENGHRQTESQSYLKFCDINYVMGMSQIVRGTLVDVLGSKGNKSEIINWAQAETLDFEPLPDYVRQRLQVALSAVNGNPALLVGENLDLFRLSAHYLARWWAEMRYCCSCGKGSWSRPDCIGRHRDPKKRRVSRKVNHQVAVRWRSDSPATTQPFWDTS